MLSLYQAEWCPHSHRVRQCLTELGLDVLVRQVPADRKERRELREATGTESIPVLVLDDGTTLAGDDEILAELRRRYRPRPDAGDHRSKLLAEQDEWRRVDAELFTEL